MERAEDTLRQLVDAFDALSARLTDAGVGPELDGEVHSFGRQLSEVVARRTATPARPDPRTQAAFLVSLAHDLRAPIGALMHQTQLLTTDSLPDDLRRRSLDALEDNAAALQELLVTLADIERLALGEYTVRTEPTNLSALVRGVIDDREGDRIVLAPQPRDIELELDPAVVRRVVGIVLDSLERGGRRWTVHLELDDRVALIRASREGAGDRARLESQPSGVTLDAGLQLAVALVELHRGRVTFTYGDAAPVIELGFPVLPASGTSGDAEGPG